MVSVEPPRNAAGIGTAISASPPKPPSDSELTQAVDNDRVGSTLYSNLNECKQMATMKPPQGVASMRCCFGFDAGPDTISGFRRAFLLACVSTIAEFATVSAAAGPVLANEATAQISRLIDRKPAPNGAFQAIHTGKASNSNSLSPSVGALPKVIQSMIDRGRGVRLQDRFDAGGGLTGYVLSSRNGERRIFYVTPDAKHALMGLMFDEKLNNLTSEHQRTYMDVTEFLSSTSSSDAEPPADALSRLASMSHAVEGVGLEVYIVAGLHSAALKDLHRQTRPRLSELKVHWFMLPSAPSKAAGVPNEGSEIDDLAKVLGSKSPSDAISALVAGHPLPWKATPANLADARTLNESMVGFMGRHRDVAPPAVIYHDAQNVPQVILGIPTKAQWDALSRDGQKVRSAQSFKGSAEGSTPSASVSTIRKK